MLKELPDFKFVIVGHVDHGKSTLIGRLLYETDSLSTDKINEVKKQSQDLGREVEFAYFLDCLEEERQQGITIDTTQVFFKGKTRQYVIIDAPGHVEFMKNMITGASLAEAAVLIVDAKEGLKEQSRRHAYILTLLGIEQIIVVLNKMDLISFTEERFLEVKKDIEEFLKSIGISAMFYIPISATKGDNITGVSVNMPWYKGPSFLESLDALKGKDIQNKDLIFPVQDVYKIDDKRVIAGRVEAGVIQTGDMISILPDNRKTSVKSIEKYLENRKSASAGESIGITTKESVFIDRSDIVCIASKEPALTDSFSANIFWMANKDYEKGERMVIRCSTQETTCQIEKIVKRMDSSTLDVIEEDSDRVKKLEVAEVYIKTKRPILVKLFKDIPEVGRFVLVKDNNITAGGIVIG